MKLTGKTKQEIMILMADYCLEETNTAYLIYSKRRFFFFRKKIYIGFNENGSADTVIYI